MTCGARVGRLLPPAKVRHRHRGATGQRERGAAPALGEKLLLVPGHCDPTVNLHDWYVGVRRGVVESLWAITARGALT